MLIVIANVIPAEEIAPLRERILGLRYLDGATTAGWHAKLVKRNLQADRADENYPALNKRVIDALSQNAAFRLATRPKSMTPLLFSRYSDGMTYGSHVDDAMIMGVRSDVSFTLALTKPEDYEGGELVMETTAGEQAFKLPAGHVIAYPSTTLHRVAPVTRGERLAAVGWLQSQLRDPQHRELLYDLDLARRSLFDREGKTREFDLMSKVSANLLRLWAEP